MAKTETEEVNLLDLLASFLAALKRNLIFTISLPIIGVLVALGVSYNSRDLFESSLLIETSLLSENECRFLFDQLSKVGTIPGLTAEEKNQLAGFKFQVIKNDPSDTDGGEELNGNILYLEVTARVYNQDVFPSLEKAIVRFVNENPSVSRHRTEREKFYNQMIAKIDNEITAMDGIKREITGKVQATYLNPSDLYAKSVDLHKQKVQFEIRRDQIKSVHLIKGFDSLTIDAKKSKIVVALTGLGIGFACLCLFLFLQFFLRYFTVYETTH
jgi:hypothetical protein